MSLSIKAKDKSIWVTQNHFGCHLSTQLCYCPPPLLALSVTVSSLIHPSTQSQALPSSYESESHCKLQNKLNWRSPQSPHWTTQLPMAGQPLPFPHHLLSLPITEQRTSSSEQHHFLSVKKDWDRNEIHLFASKIEHLLIRKQVPRHHKRPTSS